MVMLSQVPTFTLMPKIITKILNLNTARKVCKYRVISGPHFSVFRPNTGKYGPEITPYLDTFHAVEVTSFLGAVNFTKKFDSDKYSYSGYVNLVKI